MWYNFSIAKNETANVQSTRYAASNQDSRRRTDMATADYTTSSPSKEWHPIHSAPGYFASANGLILSQRRKNPKILKPIAQKRTGHLYVFINKHKRYVHHLALEAFGYVRPSGYECRHLDGDPSNNAIENLVWGTTKQNSEDRIRHGTMIKPYDTADTKLTPFDIPIIHSLSRSGYSSRAIARQFKTSHVTIQKIVRGERWKGYE